MDGLFIGFTNNSIQDFANCPLNTGPLNRGLSVFHLHLKGDDDIDWLLTM